LPGNGWIPEVAGVVTINTAAGAITVNRYIIQNRGARAIVLYWYQTPRRVIAGEWDAKFWLAADALRDRRTDTAIVRVALAIPPGQDAAATAAATAFVRRIYPLLRANLPR
jgi:EpsI family protein